MSTVLPAFRSDLEILPQIRRGKRTGAFIIQDPRTHEIFEMREEEYFLCQQLDGQTPLTTIQARFENRFSNSLPLEELEALILQLDFQGFLATSSNEKKMFHYWDAEESLIPHRLFPMFNPDRFLKWLHAHLWWCFTRTFMLGCLVLVTVGLHEFISHWTELTDAMAAIWRPEYFPLLIPVGIFLVTVPHEFTHGLVSTHYGGSVTEAGWMIFYYFLPKFYLSRRQYMSIPTQNRWRLFWVSFVGFYCQLVLFSVGIIASRLSSPEGYAHYFWTAFWSTAAIGALHNGNIAHRRDLHYVLSTWLGIVDMRTRAIETMMNWLMRRPQPEPLTHYERLWFRVYGLLALGYYIIHANLMLWAFGGQLTQTFQGPGLLLWGGLVLFLCHRPLMPYMRKSARWLIAGEAGAIKRWLVRFGCLAAIVGILLLPYPYETGGPFTILPTVQMEVHCEIDGGRIERVFVREGAAVTVGQPLAQIDPREYEKNVQTTQAQLDDTAARLRLLRKQLALLAQPPNIEQIQSLEAEVRRLQTLLIDYQRQLELTILRAPVTGRVTTPLVEQKVGQYLKKGDLFATVEQVQALQIEIQVPEGDAPQVRVGAGVKVVTWAYPHETFRGSVRDIAPIAAVPQGSTVNSVRVIAELPNTDLRLKAQHTGFAKIRTDKIPVWLVFSRLVIRWFQVQFWYWLP